MTQGTPGKRIAVIGAGIAGLSAAWLLARDHAVTLYEAADYLGGHSHTVDVTLGGVTAPVDTGFLVFNDHTYPNLIALFEHLGVRSAASDMSFSVRIENEDVEWAGSSLATVFAQKRNLARPRFWAMLGDILRFNREALALLENRASVDLSLGEFLVAGRYGREFRDWYLLPMSGAIWSCPTAQMLEYPAQTFLQFCRNHGLLQIAGRPQWRTVVGGARDYVRRMARDIDDIRLNCTVSKITRHEHGVAVMDRHGHQSLYDDVVLGCHSNQALALLADASAAEQRILTALRYQPNRALLHTDARLLPRARSAWSAWNYHAARGSADAHPVSVSYLINKLQPLPFAHPVIVTLNPHDEPAPGTIIDAFDYEHPMFDRAATDAQTALPAIQGVRRTWFCGAWAGYGFHEDGLKAGMAVAAALGTAAPWQTQPSAGASRPALAAA
ncbi:MAG: FAD-dependent oxidoreductase [Burkholderiales bacterium]|nr:FAD-dependent oxidoreductase [Burkholderiales bacterium]